MGTNQCDSKHRRCSATASHNVPQGPNVAAGRQFTDDNGGERQAQLDHRWSDSLSSGDARSWSVISQHPESAGLQ